MHSSLDDARRLLHALCYATNLLYLPFTVASVFSTVSGTLFNRQRASFLSIAAHRRMPAGSVTTPSAVCISPFSAAVPPRNACLYRGQLLPLPLDLSFPATVRSDLYMPVRSLGSSVAAVSFAYRTRLL